MPPKSSSSSSSKKTVLKLSTNPTTPERAIMLAFLICHINFDWNASQNAQVGKASKNNPVTSYRQCQKLGVTTDLSSPANQYKSTDVYGHIDGYFLPFDEKIHTSPEEWGFVVKGSTNEVEVIFVPLTAPIANKPLTTWVLSGVDVNKDSKNRILTAPFLDSNSSSNDTKYKLQLIRNTDKVPLSLQVKKSTRNLPEQISVSDKLTVPLYYDKIFPTQKKPPSPLPPVEWSWIDIVN